MTVTNGVICIALLCAEEVALLMLICRIVMDEEIDLKLIELQDLYNKKYLVYDKANLQLKKQRKIQLRNGTLDNIKFTDLFQSLQQRNISCQYQINRRHQLIRTDIRRKKILQLKGVNQAHRNLSSSRDYSESSIHSNFGVGNVQKNIENSSMNVNESEYSVIKNSSEDLNVFKDIQNRLKI